MLTGCGDDGTTVGKQKDHIRGLWHVYWKYQEAHKGETPQNAEELRTWADANLTAEDVEKLGLNSLEDAFISPRDGEPYVVLPMRKDNMSTAIDPNNPNPGQMPRGGAPIWIHEAKGVNGSRWVAFNTSQVVEVPDGQFRHMVSP